jgi:hypothetical protein
MILSGAALVGPPWSARFESLISMRVSAVSVLTSVGNSLDPQPLVVCGIYATCLSASSSLNHSPMWFQLANIRVSARRPLLTGVLPM